MDTASHLNATAAAGTASWWNSADLILGMLEAIEGVAHWMATVCAPRQRAASWWARRRCFERTGHRTLPPAAHAGLLGVALLLALLLGLLAAAPLSRTVPVEVLGMGTEAATFARLIDAG